MRETLAPSASANGLRHQVVVAVTLLLLSGWSVHPARGQDVYPPANPREIPEGMRYVQMTEAMARMTEQKFGLPNTTMRFPLLGLVIFPNQFRPEHGDFKDYVSSKFLGQPLNRGQATLNFYNNLPANDFIRFNMTLPSKPLGKQETRIAERPKRADELPWLVCHQDGETFGLYGNPDAVLMVSSGTIYHVTGPNEVTVRCGTLWAFAGQRPVKIVTKYGTTHVGSHSYVAIQQNLFGKAKVANLWGKVSEVQLSNRGEDAFVPVESGHELLISDQIVASAGTSDYIASSRLPQAILPGISITNKKLDPDVSMFVKQLKTHRPMLPNISMLRRYDHMLAHYGMLPSQNKRPAALTTATPSAYSASLDARYFVPVFKPLKRVPVPAKPPLATEVALRTNWLKHGMAKYLGTAQVTVDSFNRIFLKSGELVVCADDLIRVNAGNAHVFLEKGSIALITRKENLLIVRNLKEMWAKNVRVSVSGKSTNCSAGYEVIVGNSLSAITSELANDGIQRRNVQVSEINGGSIAVNKSEFNITTLMQNSQTLRRIYNSPDHTDKKIAAAIIKMDACLTLVTGGHGNYRRVNSAPSHEM